MTSPAPAATSTQPRLIINPVIEQAKDILVAQLGFTPDQVFDLLRRASQRANIKVSVLAAQLIDQAVSLKQPRAPDGPVPVDVPEANSESMIPRPP